MQQLMTREIAKTVPRLYEQDGAFGLVEGYDDELGYFSIKEMEELNRQMGFAAVERDEHFSPKPLSAVRRR